jgi:DNA-binding MarR family transcriptional regulator
MSEAERRVATAEIATCTCLGLRRATRQVTQLYDRALEPVGLRITQFGLLAQLFAADPIGMGDLAERLGMDGTTLTRNLKPLASRGFVKVDIDRGDRRARLIRLTVAGHDIFRRALPLWRAAQARVDERLGRETRLALNGLLDLSAARLAE